MTLQTRPFEKDDRAMASGIVPHIKRHRQGTICAKGQMLDGQLHGYWEWYRPNGSLKRSGSFDMGEKVGIWTTYDAIGAPYKVTSVKAAAETAKRQVTVFVTPMSYTGPRRT